MADTQSAEGILQKTNTSMQTLDQIAGSSAQMVEDYSVIIKSARESIEKAQELYKEAETGLNPKDYNFAQKVLALGIFNYGTVRAFGNTYDMDLGLKAIRMTASNTIERVLKDAAIELAQIEGKLSEVDNKMTAQIGSSGEIIKAYLLDGKEAAEKLKCVTDQHAGAVDTMNRLKGELDAITDQSSTAYSDKLIEYNTAEVSEFDLRKELALATANLTYTRTNYKGADSVRDTLRNHSQAISATLASVIQAKDFLTSQTPAVVLAIRTEHLVESGIGAASGAYQTMESLILTLAENSARTTRDAYDLAFKQPISEEALTFAQNTNAATASYIVTAQKTAAEALKQGLVVSGVKDDGTVIAIKPTYKA